MQGLASKINISVFAAGAATMGFEIIIGRMLAPYWGTSVEVWVGLIGVILASLSIGSYLGGVRADRSQGVKDLSTILSLSAICFIAPIISAPYLLLKLSTWISDVRLGALISVILLAAPAAILLGMATPFAVKLNSTNAEKIGSKAGLIWGLSNLGSIIGTFIVGYWLLSYLGHRETLLVLAVFLELAAILLLFQKHWAALFLIAFFLTLAFWQKRTPNLLVDKDTAYSRIQVWEGAEPVSGRPIRLLRNGPCGVQAAMYLDSERAHSTSIEAKFGIFDRDPAFIQYIDLAQHFLKTAEPKLLLLGGGAQLMPRRFLDKIPSAEIDLVEIDPEMTILAQEYFGAKNDSRIKVFHQDARVYINNSSKKYDVIVLDVFNSACVVPPHLVTLESFQKIQGALSEDGIFLINLISSVTGDGSGLLRHVYATERSLFKSVYVFAESNQFDSKRKQNFLLVASNKPLRLTTKPASAMVEAKLQHLWVSPIPDAAVLTDDYSPVDLFSNINRT